MKAAIQKTNDSRSPWPTKGQSENISRLRSCRVSARDWSSTIPERQRQQAAWTFIKAAMDRYVALAVQPSAVRFQVSHPAIALTFPLANKLFELARAVGEEASELPIEQACYQISTTYTALVPPAIRGSLGMYYTPPALTDRMLDMAEEAGIDWASARVLDPACGGGAFLLPVVLRMRRALAHLPPRSILNAVRERIQGFELDPFASWLTQTWLEVALADLLTSTGDTLPQLVRTCNTLDQEPDRALYDLVIGNPPYGRVGLSPEQRSRYKRSLYGHANLYGVFTDVAMRWARAKGIIAYVTPTSFLAGEYFKALRSLLACEAPPLAIAFVEARRGIFEDVLQEALLATYRKGERLTNRCAVHHLSVSSNTSARIRQAGHFTLPANPASPWLAPRVSSHKPLIARLTRMPHRLSDWGYEVSTGPLVWNRFKNQLRLRSGANTLPLIWAEAVTADGRFIYRAEKRGHKPYFHIGPGDEWLKVNVPCILVQRTTAKEQRRRLIAAEMPASLIKKHGAVVVENHLNMVRPMQNRQPKVSTRALAAVLNSSIADEAFRCISGSVAVSAFELEALPLPAPEHMRQVEDLIQSGAKPETVEAHIREMYGM